MRRPLALLFLLCGCGLTTPGADERLQTAERIGFGGKLKPVRIETPQFSLYGFQRITDANVPLHVYIEGDGFAWESRTRTSDDPTPLNPMSLRLAAEDDHANILYLARPCQYIRRNDGQCVPNTWTHARFSQPIVNALSFAVTDAINQYGIQEVALYGYSGGGALAMLVAAERGDVIEIRTVAANLDSDAWVAHHKVSALRGSLNPLDSINVTASIPQLHIGGSDDEVVPPFIIEKYTNSEEESGCIKSYFLEGYAHDSAWQTVWNGLLMRPNSCK